MKRFIAPVAALLLTGCPGDETNPPIEPEPSWQVVLDEVSLDRAVLSVWGAGSDAIFAVGGPLGNTPYEALALFFDGTQFHDLKPGGGDSLWWVHGTAQNDVWMVGENGRITHYDGGGFTEHDSGVDATIWGVHAFAANNVWAVAGTPGKGTASPNDLVLHYDGSNWTTETLPGDALGVSLFKVWGPSADNFYVVGEKGTIWHHEAGTWALEPSGLATTLFTVHGCGGSEVYAVGGLKLLKSTGDGSWEEQAIDPNSTINGVNCATPGSAAVVGALGLKQRLVDDSWIDEFTEPPTASELHAVWGDENGVFWAVGGDLASGATPNAERPGVIARFGPGEVASEIAP